MIYVLLYLLVAVLFWSLLMFVSIKYKKVGNIVFDEPEWPLLTLLLILAWPLGIPLCIYGLACLMIENYRIDNQ